MVEDDENQALLTARVLRELGVGEVAVARDGDGALDHLFGPGRRPGRHVGGLPVSGVRGLV